MYQVFFRAFKNRWSQKAVSSPRPLNSGSLTSNPLNSSPSRLIQKRRHKVQTLILALTALFCQNLQAKKSLSAPTAQPSSPAIVLDSHQLQRLADVAYIKAELHFLEGQSEQALTELKKAQAFKPNPHLKEKLAQLYEAQGLTTEALRIYKELQKQSPSNQKYLKKLIRIYTLNGLYKQALSYHSLLKDSSGFYWSFQKAVLLEQLRGPELALEASQKLELQNLTSDQKVRLLLFQSYLRDKLQQPQKSLQALNRLFEIDCPESSLVLQVLEHFKQAQQSEQALKYVKKWEQERGESALSTLYLLNHFLAQQNWDLAFFYAQRLEDFGQLEEEHYFYIANYLMEKKNYQKALLYLKDLSTQKPKNGYYRYLLAFTYGKNQEWDKAMASYKKVPPKSSYFLLSQLQIAQFWKKQGDYKKSLDLLASLSQNEKIKAQVLSLYAESLWLSGEKKQALSLLAQALRQYPKDKKILALMSAYVTQMESPEQSPIQSSEHKESRLSRNL